METVGKEFIDIYRTVRPIILKLRQEYFIKMWDLDDWEQEGRIVLFELLCKDSELVYDTNRLCVYFKTKFSNRVKDALRKQESIKRGFDRMAYEEVGEVAHSVSDKGLNLADLVAYGEAMESLDKELSAQEREWVTYLISGECFRGKRAFQRKLRAKMESMGWRPQDRWNRT